MLKLYHVPWSRSVRIVWLLEELDVPYELITAPLQSAAPRPFAQKTPFGKVPAIEDRGLAMIESGAIVEYILECYGDGRLAPQPLRAEFVPVHYDHQRLAKEMREEQLPDEFVQTVLTGWWTTCLEILPAKERKRGRW